MKKKKKYQWSHEPPASARDCFSPSVHSELLRWSHHTDSEVPTFGFRYLSRPNWPWSNVVSHLPQPYIPQIPFSWFNNLSISWATDWHFTYMSESPNTGVPNLWELMPDDLRWNWCNNNRNKVHNKWNVLESSLKHLPPPSPRKNCLQRSWSLVLFGTRDHWSNGLLKFLSQSSQASVSVDVGWGLRVCVSH